MSDAASVVWATDPDAPDHGFFGPDSVAWRVLSAPAVAMTIAQITNLLEVPHVDFQSVLLDHDPLYPTNAKRQHGWNGPGGGRFHDRIGRTVAVPFPILFGDASQSEMQHIAALGGGRVFDARSASLEAVFKDIRGYQ